MIKSIDLSIVGNFILRYGISVNLRYIQDRSTELILWVIFSNLIIFIHLFISI